MTYAVTHEKLELYKVGGGVAIFLPFSKPFQAVFLLSTFKMSLSWVMTISERFSRVTSFLGFSHSQYGPHLLSEVLGMTNYYLWDRWKVKEGRYGREQEGSKGVPHIVPSCPSLSASF